MNKSSSQQIGQKGEDDAREYIQTLVTKLGFKPVRNRKQAAGSQFGKDLQFIWEDSDEKYTWHFEIKTQKKNLERKDVLEKIDSVKRSAHEIDCWCVVEFYSDPVNELDESLASWNLGEYPFSVLIWSPQSYLKEQVFTIDEKLYKKIYGDSAPRNLVQTLDDIKKLITDSSLKGKQLKDSYPNDLEKKIIAGKDKPDQILKIFNQVLQASKNNSDFDIKDIHISDQGTSLSIYPHKGKMLALNCKISLKGERVKDWEEFVNYRTDKFKINSDEIIEQNTTVGDTPLNFIDEGGHLSLEHVFQDLPRMSIVGIDRSYIGFDNQSFKIRSTRNGIISADNKDANPPTIIGLEINLNEKYFAIKFPTTTVNRQSKHYAIENELAYIDFIEDIVHKKDLIITNSDTGDFVLSGKFTTDDLDTFGALENIVSFRHILNKIRFLRNHFRANFKIPSNISQADISKISVIHPLLKDSRVDIYPNETSIMLKDLVGTKVVDGQIVDNLTLAIENYNEVILGEKLHIGQIHVTYFNTRVKFALVNNETKVSFLKVDDKSKIVLSLLDKD